MIGVYHGKVVIPLVSLTVALAVAVLTSACESRYKQFSNIQGTAHFRFECPADLAEDLRVVGQGAVQGSVADGVMIFLTRRVAKDGWIERGLGIEAVRPLSTDNVHDARSKFDWDIAIMRKTAPGTQLLERVPIVVDGNAGEQILLQWDFYSLGPLPSNLQKGTPQGPTLMMTTRAAYFDRQGFIWVISMMADGSRGAAEDSKRDFEHVIRTFKILP